MIAWCDLFQLRQLRDALNIRATQLTSLPSNLESRDEAQELARRLLEDDVLPSLAAVEQCLSESKIDFTLETVEAAVASELPGALAAAFTTSWAFWTGQKMTDERLSNNDGIFLEASRIAIVGLWKLYDGILVDAELKQTR